MLYKLPISLYNISVDNINEEFVSVKEIADKWKISERSVRNYCENGRVEGAILEGKTWKIPCSAQKPERQIRHFAKKENLLSILKREKDSRIKNGIYHKIQIDLTFNSNHIEGSRLSHEQTLFIFETKTIENSGENLKIDDIIETVNHFRCVDLVIESAKSKLTESLIKQLHFILKTGTSDSEKNWFKVGGYKLLENEVGNAETAKPDEVAEKIKLLLAEYNAKKTVELDDILDFHVKFEKIHPFQDGNGRVGRLIMFKECLKHNIVPFIITEETKFYYYRGIKNWETERCFLRDTSLSCQDEMKKVLDYFKIEYEL